GRRWLPRRARAPALRHPPLDRPYRWAQGAAGLRVGAGASSRGAAAVVGLAAQDREPLLGLGALRARGSPWLRLGPAGRPRPSDGDEAGLLRRAGAPPMVTSVQAYLALLVLIALERGVELFLSARNARTARSRGGVESGQGHYPVMAAFHALFLVACAAEVVFLHRPFPGTLGWVALAAVGLAHAPR